MVIVHWLILLLHYSTQCLRKQHPPFIFGITQSKMNRFLFLVHRILKTFDIGTRPPHLKNVTALPCEMQNILANFSPKLGNFEKQLAIMLSRNLNFRQLVSNELLKVTIVCIDTPFLSFSILICHHAMLCVKISTQASSSYSQAEATEAS